MPDCTMCNKHVPNEFAEHQSEAAIQPTGGLHVSFYTGYGMFSDPTDSFSSYALRSIRLCHDCSVKIVDMFPKEFTEKYFSGGHPIDICRQYSDAYTNGCHYSWT
jgi:hypothetical protein